LFFGPERAVITVLQISAEVVLQGVLAACFDFVLREHFLLDPVSTRLRCGLHQATIAFGIGSSAVAWITGGTEQRSHRVWVPVRRIEAGPACASRPGSVTAASIK